MGEAADIVTSSATITDAEGNIPEAFEDRVSAEMMYIADFEVDENGVGDGVRIEKTWNALGMHATGTHVDPLRRVLRPGGRVHLRGGQDCSPRWSGPR